MTETGARRAKGSGRGRPATIYDVAQAAGVSHQTVSRLLKGAENISPERRARVEAALRELHYQPNEAARALATNQSRRIAAFAGHLDEMAPQLILEGAGQTARKAGYVLDIASIGGTDAVRAARAARDAMVRTPLAGVLIAASADELLTALHHEDFDVPLVIEVQASIEGTPGSPHAFELGVRHLLALGHRRFFYVGGPGTWASARKRRQVLLACLAESGAALIGEAEGDWLPGAGYAATSDLMASGATAVVCANDRMALGVLAGLRREGVAVPADVSVTGFDGLEDCAYYAPSLTTVEVDYRGLGAQVMERLLLQIGALAAVSCAPAPPRLVVGESTAPPPVRE